MKISGHGLVQIIKNQAQEIADLKEQLKAKEDKTSWDNLEQVAYWKKQYESVAKEFNTIQDRNEELERIILESGIQPQCKADKQWSMDKRGD